MQAGRQRPGRRPTLTPQEIQQRLEAEPDPAKRLELIQRRLDAQERLAAADSDEPDVETLEKAFIKVAQGYAQRKRMSYTAFRELGVPAAALKQAGIARTRGTS